MTSIIFVTVIIIKRWPVRLKKEKKKRKIMPRIYSMYIRQDLKSNIYEKYDMDDAESSGIRL